MGFQVDGKLTPQFILGWSLTRWRLHLLKAKLILVVLIILALALLYIIQYNYMHGGNTDKDNRVVLVSWIAIIVDLIVIHKVSKHAFKDKKRKFTGVAALDRQIEIQYSGVHHEESKEELRIKNQRAEAAIEELKQKIDNAKDETTNIQKKYDNVIDRLLPPDTKKT